jgi:hypothetical protein
MLTLEQLIERLGGTAAVARACGVGTSAVSNWVARGGVAAEHRLTVWRLATEAGVEWTPPGAEGLRLVVPPRRAKAPGQDAAA